MGLVLPLRLVLTCAWLFTPFASGLSLFVRTSWLSELNASQWRPWFELIKQGRAEGPASPYYVEELALQDIACCESPPGIRGCIGPKCSDMGLPPNTLLRPELEAIREYFPMFDKVHIGSTLAWALDWDNHTQVADYAQLQARLGQEFLSEFGSTPGVTWGWYITNEGSLQEAGLLPDHTARYAVFLRETMAALSAVRGLPFLWSPTAGWVTVPPSQRAAQRAGIQKLFCNSSLGHPLSVHFQDYVGQTVGFTFPFHYNYTGAFSCTRDTAPTYQVRA